MITPTWQAGDVKLYLGDCLEILPQLEAGSVDLVLTDPPYGIGINRNANNFGVATNTSRQATDLEWDDKIPDKAHFSQIFRVSKNQIVFGANYFWDNFYSSQCYIIWDKRGSLPPVPFCDTEFAWTSFVKRMSKRYVIVNHGFIRDSKDERTDHPTQKPTELMKQILVDFSEPSDTILDPFMGSGTTLVACVQTGRKGIGIEIEEKYFDIAVKRIQQAQLQIRMEL